MLMRFSQFRKRSNKSCNPKALAEPDALKPITTKRACFLIKQIGVFFFPLRRGSYLAQSRSSSFFGC